MRICNCFQTSTRPNRPGIRLQMPCLCCMSHAFGNVSWMIGILLFTVKVESLASNISQIYQVVLHCSKLSSRFIRSSICSILQSLTRVNEREHMAIHSAIINNLISEDDWTVTTIPMLSEAIFILKNRCTRLSTSRHNCHDLSLIVLAKQLPCTSPFIIAHETSVRQKSKKTKRKSYTKSMYVHDFNQKISRWVIFLN